MFRVLHQLVSTPRTLTEWTTELDGRQAAEQSSSTWGAGVCPALQGSFPIEPVKAVTYELARQLSDAGFPFVPIAAAPLTRRGRDFIAFADGPSYHEPSLTELIDECRHFHRLSHDAASDRWYAQGATFIGEGSDAEEAVARLWLQLQQKAA